MQIQLPKTIEEWNSRGSNYLPGHLEMKFLTIEPKIVTARLNVQTKHTAWNGFLHAGTVVSLADTCCGYGTVCSLPVGAEAFTTIDLTSNFLGTTTTGDIECCATPIHQGRTTQVWDATVTDLSKNKVIAHVRCTQMILWPK